MRAFNDLTADRAFGFGLGRIPFTAIAQWAECYGIRDPDMFDDLKAAIAVLDGEWLKANATASGA